MDTNNIAGAISSNWFIFNKDETVALEFESPKAKKLFQEEILINKTENIVIIGKDNNNKLLKLGTLFKVNNHTDSEPYNAELIAIERVKIAKIISRRPYIKVEYKEFPIENDITEANRFILNDILNALEKWLQAKGKFNPALIPLPTLPIQEFVMKTLKLINPSPEELYDIFQEKSYFDILKKIEAILEHRKISLEIQKEISEKIRQEIEQRQREFILREQLKTIQSELGENDDIEELKKRAKKKKLSAEAKKVFERELKHLERTPPFSPEYGVILNYLEWLIEIPWKEYSRDNFNIKDAKKILDQDHYGLEKIKERIIDYLAVLQYNKQIKAPILCFVGPPGIGKTSLARSIAKALNRKFVRISLGGVRDEAEIRGHRKTYIGAMPGKIIQGMKKAGTSNPVFLLDEIDKITADFRGDPAAALLEVLDPEQNSTFNDHFLGVDYDLSKVLFIATANTNQTIHPALLDRMEVIYLSGYTPEEKIQIAQRHLIPKTRKELKLTEKQFSITNNALQDIIQNYTKEAGVRELKQVIEAIARKIIRKILENKQNSATVKKTQIKSLLGPPKYLKEEYKKITTPGVAIGLAWTPFGGEILFIETAIAKGKSKLSLTGRLGDVMKESAQVAFAYLKANAEKLNIDLQEIENSEVFIHIPAGATPKDGPSAGITLLTALTSAFTKKTIKPDYAMTGEITLRGQILPVGGIKEKVLAARRNNINNVILPAMNKKDTEELPKELKEKINFIFVETIDQALKILLDI